MDMFKEYGITLNSLYDILDSFNILYSYIDIKIVIDRLFDIIEQIDNEEIESDYTSNDIIIVIDTLKAIENDGYSLDDFIK